MFGCRVSDADVLHTLSCPSSFLFLQNMKEVYNATFQSFPEEIRSAHDGDVLSYLNGSLDILDLGCGTGLIGSWFKDYARKLVGVDVSPTMLDMATKKGCYHELRKGVSEGKGEEEACPPTLS